MWAMKGNSTAYFFFDLNNFLFRVKAINKVIKKYTVNFSCSIPIKNYAKFNCLISWNDF